jgi:hypothetical protein
MGSQLNFYVGVYLKVEAKKVPAKSPYICPEHSSKEFWEAGFCQKCGKALVRDGLRLKTASIWGLLPDNDDELLQVDMEDKDSLVFLSNEKHSAPDHAYTHDLDEIEITKTIIDNYLRNFKNNHKVSIRKLRAVTTRLAIKFGAIQYYL